MWKTVCHSTTAASPPGSSHRGKEPPLLRVWEVFLLPVYFDRSQVEFQTFNVFPGSLDFILINSRKRKHLNIFPHKCPECPKSFYTKQELAAHIRTHTGEKPFKCTICSKYFGRIYHQKRHMETVHCQKSIGSSEIVETETHLEVREWHCMFRLNKRISCFRSPKTDKLLKAQTRNVVFLFDNKVFIQFSYSKFNFICTTENLTSHLYSGDKPFACELCHKDFARNAALRIHKISVHSDVKSYLCADCGAAFKANSALIDHRKRVHLQIKPHKYLFG